MKNTIFQFSSGEILSSLYKIFESRLHGNHCQQEEMFCVVKVFYGVWSNEGRINDFCDKSRITVCLILRESAI